MQAIRLPPGNVSSIIEIIQIRSENMRTVENLDDEVGIDRLSEV